MVQQRAAEVAQDQDGAAEESALRQGASDSPRPMSTPPRSAPGRHDAAPGGGRLCGATLKPAIDPTATPQSSGKA